MSAPFDLVVAGGTVLLPWGAVAADIGVRGGRIAAIGAGLQPTVATLDAQHLHVLPGLIDPHVHLREPGDAAVESIATGTRAALLGGIATVFDMPNTTPPVTDAEMLAGKQAHVPQVSHCDFGIYVGATRTNIADLASLELERGVCGIKLFAGSSTGDLLIEDDETIAAVMRAGRRRIAFHAEDEYRLLARRALFKTGDPYACHAEWRDPECAFLGTRRIVALARATGRPAHIVHVSTEEEFTWLSDHRDIATAEVLVNHLTQVAPECYERLGAYAIMNPPLRDRRHVDAAWRAVNDGRIDTLGSDHAPHGAAAKARPWPATAAGLAGVQTALPIMLDHVANGRLPLARLVDLMASGPARIYGALRKGAIVVGYDADFTLVDLTRRRRIENSWLATPAKVTPFDGVIVTGWPEAVVLRGRIVMQADEIRAQRGELVSFR